jgi:hypothetical protein
MIFLSRFVHHFPSMMSLLPSACFSRLPFLPALHSGCSENDVPLATADLPTSRPRGLALWTRPGR